MSFEMQFKVKMIHSNVIPRSKTELFSST